MKKYILFRVEYVNAPLCLLEGENEIQVLETCYTKEAIAQAIRIGDGEWIIGDDSLFEIPTALKAFETELSNWCIKRLSS